MGIILLLRKQPELPPKPGLKYRGTDSMESRVCPMIKSMHGMPWAYRQQKNSRIVSEYRTGDTVDLSKYLDRLIISTHLLFAEHGLIGSFKQSSGNRFQFLKLEATLCEKDRFLHFLYTKFASLNSKYGFNLHHVVPNYWSTQSNCSSQSAKPLRDFCQRKSKFCIWFNHKKFVAFLTQIIATWKC